MTGHTETLWSRNGFNLCEIIRIEEGPAPDGKTYADGRHQIHVATFARIEDAATAERAVNRDHAFDEVVKALSMCADIFDDMTKRGIIKHDVDEPIGYYFGENIIPSVRAALAKAGSAQPRTETA